MEQRKTNEGVKARLEQEANINLEKEKKNSVGKEKDAKEIEVDDVVHEPGFEPTAVFNKDTDKQTNADSTNAEKDPDDQEHGK